MTTSKTARHWRAGFTAEQDEVLLRVAQRPHANGQELYEAYVAESGDAAHGLGATSSRLNVILSVMRETMDPALRIDLVRRAARDRRGETGEGGSSAPLGCLVDGREWITAGAAATLLDCHPRAVNALEEIERRPAVHPLQRGSGRMMYARDTVEAAARRKGEEKRPAPTGELPGLAAPVEPPAPVVAPEVPLPAGEARKGVQRWLALGYVDTAPGEVTLRGERCVKPAWVSERTGLDPRAVGTLYGILERRAHPTNAARVLYTRASAERLLEELAKRRMPPPAPVATAPAPVATAPAPVAPPPAPPRSLAERLDVLNLALAAGDLTLEEHRAKVRAAVGA